MEKERAVCELGPELKKLPVELAHLWVAVQLDDAIADALIEAEKMRSALIGREAHIREAAEPSKIADDRRIRSAIAMLGLTRNGRIDADGGAMNACLILS